MASYETLATVEQIGSIRVEGLPFPPGTEVEVTISPKRKSPEEFAAAWQRVTSQLRSVCGTSNMNDDDIQTEIEAHRAGK